MRLIPAIATTTVLIAAPALAGPLDPDTVPAGAAWIVHLDVEAAVTSTVGTYVLEHAEEFDLDEPLEDMRNEMGLDPVRDLLGLTLFGEGDPEQTGVAVLVTSAAIDAIVEHASSEQDLRTVEFDGYKLYNWDDDGKAMYAHVGETARDRRVMTMAAQKALVVDAVKVREGRITSLREAGHKGAKPGPGSILFATARGLPWIQPEEQAVAAVLQRTNRLRAEIREEYRVSCVELIISARSAEDANNVSQVLQGAVALGRIFATESPDHDAMAHLLSAVSFSAQRNDVRLLLEIPSEHVARMLGMLAEMH